MRTVGMEEMKTYISRRQNTVTQYIATQDILELCLEAKHRPLLRLPKRWWEQEGFNLTGMWEADERGCRG